MNEPRVMRPGFFTQLFDSRRDLDQDQCSISLDVEIDDFVNDDLDDHTTVGLPDQMLSLFVGTGISPRAPGPHRV